MNAPYLDAISLSLYHGLDEGMFKRLPIIGSGFGPGGSRRPRVVVLLEAMATHRYHSTEAIERKIIAEVESVMLEW